MKSTTAPSNSPWLSRVSQSDVEDLTSKDPYLTFKVEKNIRLIVLEHLRDKFNIHVLNIYFLDGPVS